MPGEDNPSDVCRLEHGLEIVGQGVDGERRCPSGAQAVPALVVENDTVTLFAEAPGNRDPNFVATAPTVGEHDYRRVESIAWQVPDGELRAVVGGHDLVVGPGNSCTPPEGVALVVVRLTARRHQAPSGDAGCRARR